jgi:hypothetical protein
MGKRPAFLAVAVLVLAGCGGNTSSGPAPAASRDEFAAQANRICRVTATQAERVAALRRLRPPAVDKELYAHWLTAERDALSAAKALANLSRASDGDDPLLLLTIAEGKIAGYSLRFGAQACARLRVGRMLP